MDKRTKIVATISDRHCEPEFIRSLYEAGMNAVRINSAHLTTEGATKIVENVRRVSEQIAIIIDTKGPEIRVTGMSPEFAQGIPVATGDRLLLKGTDQDAVSSKECIYLNYAMVCRDVPVGAVVLIDDGEIELHVLEKKNEALVCEVCNGGVICARKSVNIPGVAIDLPSVTERDARFIDWAIENDIDFVAHSFVRKKEDVLAVKEIIKRRNSSIKIISKIENREGVDNIDKILDETYGIMVARGDLGVEIPAEEIPVVQRFLVNKCIESKKPVIIATQMLHTMITHPRPTRAEISDVANAIYDGTDAIMLSGESAAGLYPEEAVKTMSKINEKTETALNYPSLHRQAVRTATDDTSEAICMSVAEIATKFGVSTIIAFTQTGFTARKMSRYRPEAQIVAATPETETIRSLALSWGVKPVLCKTLTSRGDMIEYARIIAKENGAKEGDLILVTGGAPGVKGDTSYLELVRIY